MTSRSTRIHPTVAVGVGLILLQVGFRAWAVSGGWFYEDDLELHRFALITAFNWDYLTEVHSGHLMPIGRALVELAVLGGAMNWSVAAVLILTLQAMVSLAGLWAMLTLFGQRFLTIGLFAIYLGSAITLPATVWWSAVLNQSTHQLALWLAIGAWVQHERQRSRFWLGLTLVAVSLALLTDVRGVLLLPALALISMCWFADGSALDRLRHVFSNHVRLLLTVLPLLLGYAYLYSRLSSDVTSLPSWSVAGELADRMLGSTFLVGAVGGPWRWQNLAPAAPVADPPSWAVSLTWVIVALVVTHVALTRTRALRAFSLVVVHVGMLYLILLFSRAPQVGAVIGGEYRFLTDAAAMTVVSVGLAYLPLVGAVNSSSPREKPLFTGEIPRWLPSALILAVLVGSMISSVRYVHQWHGDRQAADDYVTALQQDLARLSPVDLANGPVPPVVVSRLIWGNEGVENLTSMLRGEVVFPDASDWLGTVDGAGQIRGALIDSGVTSEPGPVAECGWKIEDGSLRIPLTGQVFELAWWLRIGYLAPEETDVVIRAGNTVVKTQLKPGINSLFVKNLGGFDNVYIGGIDPDVTICVDTIEVGTPVPGRPLQ